MPVECRCIKKIIISAQVKVKEINCQTLPLVYNSTKTSYAIGLMRLFKDVYPAKSLAIKYSALLAKQAAVYSQWVNHMTESGWIEFLKKQVKKDKNVLVVSVTIARWSAWQEKFLLKSDLFIEGVHFKIGKTGFKDIGRRAIARVLSDFCRHGG